MNGAIAGEGELTDMNSALATALTVFFWTIRYRSRPVTQSESRIQIVTHLSKLDVALVD
jgi:hypothetical protein